MKRNKRGVSLIVLVITIIVMIILASAIMISLSSTNIFNKANEAVDASNLQEVQQMASLIWSEAYLDGKTIDKNYIVEKLAEQGVDTSNYIVGMSKNGVEIREKFPSDWKASVREVTDDGVPIPIGFVKSPYPNEGTKDGGLVIYALTESEIGLNKTTITDSYQTALETRNQFVWVPVDDFENEFKRKAFEEETLSETLGTEYWELVVDANNMISQNTSVDNTENYVSLSTLQEATEMYESVKKYGGFYIARYEVGSNETFSDTKYGHIATRATKDNISNLSITMGKYPYVYVSWGNSTSDETSNDGAVSLARAFYPSTNTTYGVVSTLTYGVQWDRTLTWWKELDLLDGTDDINLAASSTYGAYDSIPGLAGTDLNKNAKASDANQSNSYINTWVFDTWHTIGVNEATWDSLLSTGAYKKASVYNIYDMAGNLMEWTMEGEGKWCHVVRDGGFLRDGNFCPVTRRYSLTASTVVSAWDCLGFRPSLYIK